MMHNQVVYGPYGYVVGEVPPSFPHGLIAASLSYIRYVKIKIYNKIKEIEKMGHARVGCAHHSKLCTRERKGWGNIPPFPHSPTPFFSTCG